MALQSAIRKAAAHAKTQVSKFHLGVKLPKSISIRVVDSVLSELSVFSPCIETILERPCRQGLVWLARLGFSKDSGLPPLR